MTHREILGGLSPVWGSLQRSWGKVWGRNSPPEKETATETMCEELMVISILSFPDCRKGGGRESRIKLSLGGSGEWGEGFWRFRFISYYSTLIWLAINSNNFPQVGSVFTVMVIGEWSFPGVIFLNELLVTFSLTCPAEDWRSYRVALASTWHSARTASIVLV